MEKDTLTLKIKTQKLNDQELENTVTGFILNHNNKNHIITVHHFLPISSVYDMETNNELTIQINSSWNEALILETDNVEVSKYKIFSKVHYNIPKPECTLFIQAFGKRHELKIIGYDMIPFDNIQQDILIPLIRAKFLLGSGLENFAGFSGSPVFIKNKIVGVFTKIRKDDNIAYIIPIYVITKNLDKLDNSNIYTTNVSNIKKIGSWVVNKDNEIYHPTLKFNIPVSSYFLLEGDSNFKTIIFYGNGNVTVDFLPSIVKTDLSSCCDNNIIKRNDSEYKINTRLLSFLKTYEFDSKVLHSMVIALTKYRSNFWLKIADSKISITKD
jgi:hypothetical protein